MHFKISNFLFLYFIFLNFTFAEVYQNVNSWLQLSNPPVKKQDSGVCVVYAKENGKDKIFSIPGGSREFQIYDIEKNKWANTTELPFAATSGTSMCWDGNNFIYILLGGTTFYRYEINTESFIRLADLPEVNLGGGSIVYVVEENNFNFCYAIFGGTNCFYRYNIQQDKWENLSSAGKTGPGSCLLWAKTQYIYASRLGSSSNGNLKRYKILTGSWENLQSLENNWGAGGSLCWNENLSGEIFAIRGANSTDFYKYVISEDKWYKLENLPVTVGNNTGNRLATVGDYIYARLGSNSSTDSFWRYRITDTKPPGSITYLNFQNTEEGNVILSWIVPGNDSYLGDFEGSFIVKFSSSESQFFSQKDIFEIEITTFAKQGNTFKFEIDNLQDKTSYYFCIQAKDNYNNFSEPLYRVFYVEKIPLPEKLENIYLTPISTTEIFLNWENSFCFGYRIEISTCLPYVWNFKGEVSPEINYFIDKNLFPSTTYYYRIVPLGSKKQPYYEFSSDIVYGLTYSLSPINFRVDKIGVSSVSWCWDNLEGYDGVRIYDFKTNELLIELPSYTKSYTEEDLLPNTLYERKIVSFNKTGESLNYSYFSVYTLAARIIDLKIKSIGVDYIELEWSKNNPEYTRYGIFYSLDNFELDFSTYVRYEDNFTSNSIIIKNLKPDKNYYFRVVAYNQQGIHTDYVEISTKTKHIEEYIEICENFDSEILPYNWKLSGVTRTQSRSYSSPYSISNFTSSNYLYTPLIQKPIKVTFMLYATGGSSTFRVELSTSLKTNSWIAIYSTNSVANIWQKHEIDLYNYENVYLRMNRSSGQNSFNLDDFIIYCIPNKIPPSAISDLEAVSTPGEAKVMLSWSSPYEDDGQFQEFCGKYIIKISSKDVISSDNFDDKELYTITIQTFTPSNTKVSFTLKLIPDQTYYFAIKAEDIYGNRSAWHSFLESQVNKQAFCYTFDSPPQTPKGLATQKLNSNSVLISWESSKEQDLDYYVLEYKKNAQQEVFIATITKNTSFIHNNLENSCSYYYRIKAVDSPPTVLESQYSDFICIYLDKPKNLLKNEFFNFWNIFQSSSSPKYWIWSGSAKNIKFSTDSLVGIYSAEVTLTSSLETLSQLNIPLVSTQTYYIEALIKGKGIINLGIVKGNNSSATYSDDYIINTSSWVKISYILTNDKEGVGGVKLRFTKSEQTGEKIYIDGVWFSNGKPSEDWLFDSNLSYVYDLIAKPIPHKQSEVLLEWTTLKQPSKTVYRIKYSTFDFLSFYEYDPYNIELSTTIAIESQKISLTITGLKPSATYYFAVIFKNPEGWSFWFKNEFINCENYCYVEDLRPSPPQNVLVESLNKKLKLSWSHPQPEDDIKTYRIYFSTYEFNATYGISYLEIDYPLNSILISGLKNNLTYYLRLSTLDKQAKEDSFYGESLESELSELFFSIPKIRPPTELYCIHFGTFTVLNWNESLDAKDENFCGYNIYRSTSLDKFILISANLKSNVYVDIDISPNQLYYYILKSCDNEGQESSPSNLANAIFDIIPPRFSFVSSLNQKDFLNTKISISLKVEDDIFELNDKKGRIVSIVGKYRRIEDNKEFDIVFNPIISNTYEYIGEATIDLSVFKEPIEGIEYYFLVNDGYNTTRYPLVGWQKISYSKDVPEKKILTFKNKELIFGIDVEEVEIRDFYGNEIWTCKNNGSLVVWKASDKNGNEVESGFYVYQIKTKDKKIKYGVVIIVK